MSKMSSPTIDQSTNQTNFDTNNDNDFDLDIDADSETFNKQMNSKLNTGSNEQSDSENNTNNTNNANNNLDINTETSQTSQNSQVKICKVDKNMLKTLIIEWLALDDQLAAYRDAVKDITEEKKQYETQILQLMTALKQEVILTDKGNLTKNVKETKESLTPELIKKTLGNILKCTQTAETYTNEIMESRTAKEKVSLKRKEIRTKKTKSKAK